MSLPSHAQSQHHQDSHYASPYSHSDLPTNTTMSPDPSATPPATTTTPTASTPDPARPIRRSSTAASVVSTASTRLRAASIKLMDADPPVGMWAATGSHISKAPTLADIRRGSFDRTGWKDPAQGQGRSRGSSQSSMGIATPSSSRMMGPVGEPFPAVKEGEREGEEEVTGGQKDREDVKRSTEDRDSAEKQFASVAEKTKSIGTEEGTAYVPPPPLPWTTSTLIGLRAFWHWFLTIPGFLITIYGLNVVAWGGMLFLLLCNAAPAMCHPTCDDINSPRRVWVEIDSQILNALFCVTGFGLAPWRFRDLYWWAWWRLGRKQETKSTGLRRLAGINNGWFRLPGSDTLGHDALSDPNNPSVPIPLSKAPSPPLTGVRAPPTRLWTLDFVVWMNVWNTFFQCCLAGFMWGMNRFNRPSWATGLFVALACIVAGLGGIVMFQEGKKVKKVEGVPISREERRARGWPLEDEETGPITNGTAGVQNDGKDGLKNKIKRAFG